MYIYSPDEQISRSEKLNEDSSVVSAEDERINEEVEEEEVVEEDVEDVEEEEKEEEDEEEDKRDEVDDKLSETLPWQPLCSGVSLFSLRDSNKDDLRRVKL